MTNGAIQPSNFSYWSVKKTALWKGSRRYYNNVTSIIFISKQEKSQNCTFHTLFKDSMLKYFLNCQGILQNVIYLGLNKNAK